MRRVEPILAPSTAKLSSYWRLTLRVITRLFSRISRAFRVIMSIVRSELPMSLISLGYLRRCASYFLIWRSRSASIHSDVDMFFTERGSVVSYAVVPEEVRAVTGAIGAGAVDVFLAGGLDASLASIFPISRACKRGLRREIRSASL